MNQVTEQELRERVSAILVTLREQKNKTQNQVAADLGITREKVNQWENGKQMPTALNCTQLANYYQVPIDFLLGRIKKETHTNELFWFDEPHQKVAELWELWQNKKLDTVSAGLLEKSIYHGCLKLPIERDQPLEEKLKNKYPCLYDHQNIRVVQVPEWLKPIRKILVSNAAAELFSERIDQNSWVAFSGGSAILSMARLIRPDAKKTKNINLFSLDSTFLTNQLKLTAATIIGLLQINLDAHTSAFQIYEGPDPKTGAALFKADIHRLTRQDNLNLAFLGVGNPYDTGSYSYAQVTLTESELKRLDVKAEILLQLIDSEGREIDHDFNHRGAAIPLKVLHEINERRGLVVGVVSGQKKAEALQAALKGGYLSGVVVDKDLAKSLIS
jgi:DNA-binding transcriptional regulator LsrR (DeoR family)